MNLNEVQEGVLTIAFHVADKEGMLLLDLDDLQAMLVDCGERADELTLEYGNVCKQSVGAIQRSLLQLRSQGGDNFFGEPALELDDFIVPRRQRPRRRQHPCRRQAHGEPASLFDLPAVAAVRAVRAAARGRRPAASRSSASSSTRLTCCSTMRRRRLLEKVEQVVRLIRSKGVGVYFITQNPIDIPDKVAGQLGNRVQHKLNAFTPRDQQAVQSAAETFRPNPEIDVSQAITELKIGEALVSLLQPDGSPSPVQRTLIKPPSSRVGPITNEERRCS